MLAYYNEMDPNAAAWLRELIKMELIANGIVDERSIEDVKPEELREFTQCHFFAGIGVWSYALRSAGVGDDVPLWTGSCPCQPFSAAGKGAGVDDLRHLWPAWQHLIRECKPDLIFGEQVEAAINHGWLDLVHADLEGEGYAFASVGIPAAGVGSPHIRQRLWFVAERLLGNGIEINTAEQRQSMPGKGRTRVVVANAENVRPDRRGGTGWRDREKAIHDSIESRLADMQGERCGEEGASIGRPSQRSSDSGEHVSMANAESIRSRERHSQPCGSDNRSIKEQGAECISGSADSVIADPDDERSQRRPVHAERTGECVAGQSGMADGQSSTDAPRGFWRLADWLFCRDGKWRPVEPGTFPLVAGLAKGVVSSSYLGLEIDANKTSEARTMRLKGYGNAINAEVAIEFIKSYRECRA